MITLPSKEASPRFEILGRPAAWRDGQPLDLGPGKQQAVLAVLLLTPNRPVPTTAIVDAVWGDEPPDNGANVVQKYVAGLRRVLEPDRSPRSPGRLLTLSGAGYALHVPRGGLDADVFRDRVKEALAERAAGDVARAGTLLRDALDMWRGPALAGLNGGFFTAARDRLEEERAAALEASAEIGLDLREHARLVPELIRLVAEFPLREGFRYLLMLALYRSGRQAEALAAYRDARAFFAEEFGSEPGERLQSLHVGILRSDPSLAAPGPGAARRSASEPPDDDGRPAADAADTVEAVARPSPPVPSGFAPPDPRLNPAPVADAPDAPGGRLLAYPAPAAAPAPPPSWPSYNGPAFANGSAFGNGVAGYSAAPAAWGAWPAPVEKKRPAWPLRAVLASIPLLSLGLATWAVLAYFAARRRSWWLALASAVQLGLTVLGFGSALASDVDQTTWWDVPMMFSLLATMLGGAVHLVVLTAEPWSPPPPDDERAAAAMAVPMIEQRVRREQARSLVAHHPEVARHLGIGRPDVARAFDDGGLIDVNTAPEHVLAALPGLEPSHAKLIVLSRTAQGPLATVDDLVHRQIMPFQTVHALRETLIAVPPNTDAAVPDEEFGAPAAPAAGG
ncbi:BTAD domain-containing putative transcriptional regulator [Actinomadura sp. KC216]|uniref:BTAD domain-containing putative transcriptional regulator n=1 Tax=Actinomadura sp. KC216 TaxID=2530370 RepID=UPI001404D747|nr:BTAD domain-containing putative transcriptional regulator [Actinomadura sp. KC216]